MGLIQAAIGSVGGTLADQWKEFFSCDALDANVLVARGTKKVNGRSSNTSGDDNVITDGSKIVVANGQCVITVSQGKIVEVCAQPGEYIYDAGTAPTVFNGDLGTNLEATLRTMANRFTYGGIAPQDQRIYYVNTKEIVGRKFGTAQPVPFRNLVEETNQKLNIHIRCFGSYSIRIVDPVAFYANVCGNIEDEYRLDDELATQMRGEFMMSLGQGLAKAAGPTGMPYIDLPLHTMELADGLNEALSKKWGELRGIKIVSVAIESVTALPEDEEKISKLQEARSNRLQDMELGAMLGSNAAAQQGMMVNAAATAMQSAASNPNGAMAGFMGMGMAQQAASGVQVGQTFGGQQPAQQPVAAGGWTCSCGAQNTGKFCQNCGKPQPAPAAAWTCSCGAQNTGKFCQNCGKPAPAAEWTCQCGAVNKGKFCQNCGKARP